MATVGLLSIAASRIRHQVLLEGVRDNVNREFTIPNGEKAQHNPSGGIKILAYHNTRRLQENEWEARESGGAGTGVDTIYLTAFAPPSTSRLFIDFIAM